MPEPEGTQVQQQGAPQGTPGAVQTGTPAGGQQGQGTGNGSSGAAGSINLADQVNDPDTRDWLTRSQIADVPTLARKALEQERAISSSIRLPGKDATDEERAAFYEKIGRPKSADEYSFEVPKDLPPNLPYDGEMAGSFKTFAHSIGLTQEQAAKAHDWFVEQQVNAVQSTGQQAEGIVRETAGREREKLEKLWGPADGQTAKANAEFADRALSASGDPAIISDLQKAGIIGPNKEMLNANFAVLMAKLGSAIFTEDDVVRGNPAAIGNPFDEKSPAFNLTKAMQLYREDPEHAKSLMYAAGKAPGDFGLK